MTREELIKRLSYRGQFGQLVVDTVGIGPLLDEAIAMLKADQNAENKKRFTNKEWIDLLSEQFDVSRTSAKDMLHVMMLIKRKDDIKRRYSGSEGGKDGKMDANNQT